MNEAYIKEIFSDEAFVKSFLELETPEEVQSALKEKNIDMTEDEIITLRDDIVTLAEKAEAGEELSLEQLDEAAGGAFVTVCTTLLVGIAIVGTIGAAGTGIGAALGFGLGKFMGSRRW